MKDKPIARRLEFTFAPIVSVYVEEFEDGTFHVKTYSDIDWDGSFSSIYDEEAQAEVDPNIAQQHPAWGEVDNFLSLLALREYYQPAWTPEDEPF